MSSTERTCASPGPPIGTAKIVCMRTTGGGGVRTVPLPTSLPATQAATATSSVSASEYCVSQSTYLCQCNQFASDRQPHRAELLDGPLRLGQCRHCDTEAVQKNKERKFVAQRALRRVQQRLQGSKDGVCRLLGDAHDSSLYWVSVVVPSCPCEPRLALFGIGTGVERDGACQVGCVQVGYKGRNDCAVKTVRALDALQDLVERKRLGLASLGGAPHRPTRCRAHFAIVLETRCTSRDRRASQAPQSRVAAIVARLWRSATSSTFSL